MSSRGRNGSRPPAARRGRVARGRGHARVMALLVGTSGFDYKDWRGSFYPRFLKSGDRLAFYAEHFDTVELNVTFYRMPKAEAFRGWRDAVPDEFRFAVKASRYLTHIKRLEDPQGPVEFLMERAASSATTRGRAAAAAAQPADRPGPTGRTLEAFRGAVPVAVEPRHKSWFVPELCELLRAARRGVRAGRPTDGPITPLWATPTGRTCGSTRGEPRHGRATAQARCGLGGPARGPPGPPREDTCTSTTTIERARSPSARFERIWSEAASVRPPRCDSIPGSARSCNAKPTAIFHQYRAAAVFPGECVRVVAALGRSRGTLS